MRSKASVNIEFGLLNVPVQVCLGTKKGEDDVKLERVSEGTKKPFKQQYVDDEGKILGKDVKAVRGVKTDQGFIVIPEADIKIIEDATKVSSLKIDQFVDKYQVPVELYRGFNYLQPQKGADRAFRLLHRVLKETGQVALTKWTPRTRQQILCIRPHEMDVGGATKNVLIASELYFGNEVRMPDAKVTDACEGPVDADELELAKQLVTRMSTPEYDHSKYDDDRNVKYEELIAQAMQGQKPAPVDAPATPPASDLKKALEGSLG